MREIRIENVKSLVHVVLGLKNSSNFLVGKVLYDVLENESTACDEMKMKFTTKYGEVAIDTVVKFTVFCKAFYRLESIAVDDNLIYGYSEYVDNYKKQVVLDVE